MSATTRLPEASLLEEWTVARTQHWARTFGAFSAGNPVARPAAAPAPTGSPQDAHRASRRTEHLLRLASDDRATAHERALAAERAADLLRRFA